MAAIDEVLPGYRSVALSRIERHVYTLIVVSLLNRAAEYITLERAWEKLIPYISMGAFHEVFSLYEKYLTAREEELKAIYRDKIERYARLLKEYAERYPDLTVRGLLLFVNTVDFAVKATKRELEEYRRLA